MPEQEDGRNVFRRNEVPQAVNPETEEMWEGQGPEGILARFNKFLGFSIEGGKDEVLNFFNSMKKMRDRGHAKGCSEPKFFYRELKKLDWSIKNKRVNRRCGQEKGVGSSKAVLK